MRSQLTVRDLMTSKVFAVTAGQSLSLAETIMRAKHVRHIPVVDGSGELQGLITHRDLLKAKLSSLNPAGEGARSEFELRVPISQVMRTDIWTVRPDTLAVNAARLLQDHAFGCLPVVSHGKLIGLVTEADFLALVTDSLELGPPEAGMTLADVMTDTPEVVRPSDTLDVARSKMLQLDLRHLPIVNAQHVPIGMLSDRDLQVAEAVAGRGSEFTVGLIGSEEPFCLQANSELGPALLDLATERRGSVMVVNDSGQLVGILTSTDVCRLLGERVRRLRPAPPKDR